MQIIDYVIIQAGGKGTRLKHLTLNKPKALVTVKGEPLVLRTMSRMPKAKFFIIADYKRDVLQKYLDVYAKDKYDYQIVYSNNHGTCSGVKECIDNIPDGKSFLLVWCDLYFEKDIIPSNLDIDSNYLGLSNTFPCRWRFINGQLEEHRSNDCGVAGVYLFKEKSEISDIPLAGEFCRYLQNKVVFKKYFLEKVYETGTLAAYRKFMSSFVNARPFNKLVYNEDKVFKSPCTALGIELAKKEVGWYKFTGKYNWSFLPKIFKFSPLVLKKINGKNIFDLNIGINEKKIILKKIINNLKTVHSVKSKFLVKDICKNNHEAILDKTKIRLDTVESLIPFMQNDFITINNKKCINFYRNWTEVEKMAKSYLDQSNYCLIHGDPTFSNTLYDKKTKRVHFIDPRGYYGKSELFGDPDYDWAKLYYSVIGDYDQFNLRNFKLLITENNVEIKIKSNNWRSTKKVFFDLTGTDKGKINFFHAIMWLSLTTWSWDNYDSICGAFYRGIYLMQEYYEKTSK